MSETAYQAARIEELEDERGWAPIRRRFDVRGFGVNAWTAREAGEPIIPEHDEQPSGHEELYLVASGRARFSVGGEELDAPAGTLVFVRDPQVRRGAEALDAGTTVVVVGAAPGRAFRPRAWETNAEVVRLLDAGEHGQAKQVLEGAFGRYEDEETLHYNLACAEALLGETEAALDHLRTALAARPDWGEMAADDGDLAALRGDPRFDELVGGRRGG